MGKRINFIIFIFITVSILYSCRPSRLITEVYEEMEIDEVYTHFNNLHQNIETYSVRRINISLTNGDSRQSVRGSVRIKRDSIILLSFNMFAGIEAARIKLTPDSVLLVDRVNREYLKRKYIDSYNILPFNLDFYELQSVFIGKPPNISANMDDSFKEIEYENNDNITILKFSEFSNFQQRFSEGIHLKNTEIYLSNSMLINRILINDTGSGYNYKIDYEGYSEIDGVILPSKIDILQFRDDNVIKITMQMSGIEINRDIAFPFSLPNGYNELLKVK